MKELDWTFDEEETNPNDSPLKKGDRIHYLGPVIYYKNGHYHKLSYVKFTDRITCVIKQNDQWLFTGSWVNGNNYSSVIWIVYNEKYTKFLSRDF